MFVPFKQRHEHLPEGSLLRESIEELPPNHVLAGHGSSKHSAGAFGGSGPGGPGGLHLADVQGAGSDDLVVQDLDDLDEVVLHGDVVREEEPPVLKKNEAAQRRPRERPHPHFDHRPSYHEDSRARLSRLASLN